MKYPDPSAQRKSWLTRALCRRYAAVVFSTLSAPVPTNQLAKDRTICWAFGCLVKGESEQLGASPATTAQRWPVYQPPDASHDAGSRASVSSSSSPALRPSALEIRRISTRVGACSPRSILPM